MKKAINVLVTGLFSWLLISCLGQTHRVHAAQTPVVTLGSSLTPEQKAGTLKTLTAALSGSDYQTITVTGADLVKYLNPSGANFTTASGVWSSAMIQENNDGSGINVHILPYQGRDNITTITANQYKNAALTAGISNADIYVTSATPIDGSGALAGVYAAYAQNGNHLNQSQVNAAQNEMNVLSQITQTNKGKSGYSDAQLNNAIAGAKSAMAKAGTNVSNQQIQIIVNNQIKINHLENVITASQKQEIIQVLIQIRDSGALKNHNFREQANQLADQIQNGAKNIFAKFNTPQTRNWFQKMIDSIVHFFRNLFGGVIIVH